MYQYLIILKPQDDAERKRLEYITSKWENQVTIDKQSGIVALVDGNPEQMAGFTEELRAKASEPANVAVYDVQESGLAKKERELLMEASIDGGLETAQQLVAFVLARQKAALLPGQSPEAPVKTYTVASRKGKVTIEVKYLREAGRVKASLRIRGYGEGVDLLHRRLEEDLQYLRR